MVHIEKIIIKKKRHAFRSPRRLKTMVTGTHEVKAPSDSEAPNNWKTVNLCGTEVPNLAQTLLPPLIFPNTCESGLFAQCRHLKVLYCLKIF